MPQLNPEFYVSQISWLAATFIFLLLFLWKISLPRIKNALERRNAKINENLQNAKKIQMDSEKIYFLVNQIPQKKMNLLLGLKQIGKLMQNQPSRF